MILIKTQGSSARLVLPAILGKQRALREIQKPIYRIVASTNTCYYSENQLFVQRSQYVHKDRKSPS